MSTEKCFCHIRNKKTGECYTVKDATARKAIDELNSKHASDINGLTEQISTQSTEIEELNSKYTSDFNDLNNQISTNSTKIEEIESQYSSDIESLNEQLSNHSTKIQEIESKQDNYVAVKANDGQEPTETLNTLTVGDRTYRLPTGSGGGASVSVINSLNSESVTDALAANQGRILNEKIETNKESIINLNEGVASNTSSINKLQEQVKSLEFSPEEINQLRQDVADAVETTNEVTAQVGANTQVILDNQEDILKINGSLSSYDNRISNNTENINKNTNAIENQGATIQQHSSDIQRLRNDLNSLDIQPDEIEALRTEVNQSTQKVNELDGKVDTIDTKVDGFDNRITTNTNNISSNSQNIAKNTSNISKNTSKIEEHSTQISEINQKINELDISASDISELKQDVETLSNDIPQMKEDINTNKEGVSKLNKDFGNIETNVNNLSTTVNGFNERVSSVEAQASENATNISDHTTQIENINTRLDNLSVTPEDIQELQQSVNNLSAEIPQIKSDIETNSNGILTNKNSIDGHTETLNSHANLISSNTDAIEKNAEDILSHTTDITNINNRIDNLDLSPEDVEELKASVEQFSQEIGELQTSVTQNTSNIAENTNKINANSSAIETNRLNIEKKQDTLSSGVNIKTINKESILGSGNLNIDKVIQSSEIQLVADKESSDFINLINEGNTNNLARKKIHYAIFSGSDLTNTTWVLPYPVPATFGGHKNINYICEQYPDISPYKIWVNDYDNGGKGKYFLYYESGDKAVTPTKSITIRILSGSDVTNDVFVNWLKNYAKYIKYEYVKIQDEISNNNLLNADLIEENENKNFVSQNEKTTWGNKQNKLIQGTNVVLTENADGTTTISTTGSGGGEGGGSSVEINSTDTPVGVANFIKVNGLNYSVGYNNGSSSSNSSLPIGSIFSSALPQLDTSVHLLDGSTIALNGVYKDFVNLVKTLVNAGYNLTCSQEEYDNYVNTTGSCGKFVLDEENNTLRLPTITTFVQGLTDLTNIGNAIEAGLPNIEGSAVFGSNSNVAPIGKASILSGSFRKGNPFSSYVMQNASGSYEVYSFELDASLSNPIYGNSDTVQPPAVQYPYYIVLASGGNSVSGEIYTWVDGNNERITTTITTTKTTIDMSQFIEDYVEDGEYEGIFFVGGQTNNTTWTSIIIGSDIIYEYGMGQASANNAYIDETIILPFKKYINYYVYKSNFKYMEIYLLGYRRIK